MEPPSKAKAKEANQQEPQSQEEAFIEAFKKYENSEEHQRFIELSIATLRLAGEIAGDTSSEQLLKLSALFDQAQAAARETQALAQQLLWPSEKPS